tara:strand:- start:79 stop:726 length:648 start_codon:yes stop_codon:yes gene_type:complete
MIPASTVNAKNYHLLGNRITGESRASRMKRVNALTPYAPSLIDRNPPKVHKINPTKPMNLGTSHASQLGSFVIPSVISGATAFGLSSFKLGSRKSQVNLSMVAAATGTVAGGIASYQLSEQRFGAGDPFLSNSGNNPWDNIVGGIVSVGLPFWMAFSGHGKKNRTKAQRNADYKRATLLAVPGVGLSLLTNAIYTLPIYLSSVVGVYYGRKYFKI